MVQVVVVRVVVVPDPQSALFSPGSSGGSVYFLRESVPVPGGEQEVEEPLCVGAKQLHHKPVREQDSKLVCYISYHI